MNLYRRGEVCFDSVPTSWKPHISMVVGSPVRSVRPCSVRYAMPLVPFVALELLVVWPNDRTSLFCQHSQISLDPELRFNNHRLGLDPMLPQVSRDGMTHCRRLMRKGTLLGRGCWSESRCSYTKTMCFAREQPGQTMACGSPLILFGPVPCPRKNTFCRPCWPALLAQALACRCGGGDAVGGPIP